MLANGQLPESLCSRIIGAGTLGTISTDLWGNVVHWSSEAEAMFGWTRDSAVGRHLDELLALVLPGDDGRTKGAGLADPPAEGNATGTAIGEVGIFEILAQGASWSGTLAKSRLRDGSPSLVAATPFTSTRGAVIGHVVLCTGTAKPARTDLSEEHDPPDGNEISTAPSDAPHVTPEMFRRVFTDGPVGTALVGNDGLILDVNGSLCRSLGLSPEELIGKNFGRIQSP